MRSFRIGFASVALMSGLSIVLFGRQPVVAKTKPTLSVLQTISDTGEDLLSVGQQDPPRKVFPKVDPKDEIPLPEGKGKDTTKKVCGNCHSTNVWVKQRHTPEKWSSITDNMISKGMEASDDDLEIVDDYLGTYLAPPPKDAPPAKDQSASPKP